jgi:hypothetical protein
MTKEILIPFILPYSTPDRPDVILLFCYYVYFAEYVYHNIQYTKYIIIFFLQPVPQEKLKRAKIHIREFLKFWRKMHRTDACMTYKFHSLIHILDDCAYFLCHLEFLSSYIYENFHSNWANWLRSGNLPLHQLRFVHFKPSEY